MHGTGTKSHNDAVKWLALAGLVFAACTQQPLPITKERKTEPSEPLKVVTVNSWELPAVFQKGNFIKFQVNGAKTSDRQISDSTFAYKILDISGKWVHLEQDCSGKSKDTLRWMQDDIKEHLEKPEEKRHDSAGQAAYCRLCKQTPWWISDVGWWNTDYMLNVILVEGAP